MAGQSMRANSPNILNRTNASLANKSMKSGVYKNIITNDIVEFGENLKIDLKERENLIDFIKAIIKDNQELFNFKEKVLNNKKERKLENKELSFILQQVVIFLNHLLEANKDYNEDALLVEGKEGNKTEEDEDESGIGFKSKIQGLVENTVGNMKVTANFPQSKTISTGIGVPQRETHITILGESKEKNNNNTNSKTQTTNLVKSKTLHQNLLLTDFNIKELKGKIIFN
jgi:hypothetical protein